MNINLIFDAAAEAAPAAFRNTMEEAASIIGSMFTDNITVNINIDYSGTGGGAGAGPDNGTFVSYSTVYNYLTSTASPGDSSFDYLPVPGSANAPSEVVVWNAQLKAMGLLSPNSTTTDDGSATFATDINPNLLLGVALHELTHAIGRVPYSYPDIMELDRFSSAGARVYDGNVPASEASYFSINGGKTEWAQYGVNSDPSDFLNAVNYGGDGTSPLTPNDPFNQYYTGNTLQYLTPVDLELMDTLGFHLKFDAPAEDAYDFNGSNSGDILLQSASGQIEYVNMAGGSDQGLPVNVANVPGYKVVGEGKISGGVDSDVVIQSASGGILYANMQNGVFNNWVGVSGTPGWNVVGVGDIADDHYADIVIQNPNTGAMAYANMDNGVFNNWLGLPAVPGYKAVAVADINGDGYADIVLQSISGGIIYDNMDNGVFTSFVGVTGTPGWNVVGAGDIQRDGYADIVIQNPTTGAIDYANMDNGVFNGWVGVGAVSGWNVIGVEDVLGNGFDDIVTQNSTTGQIDYANMTPGATSLWVAITSAPGYTGATGPAPTGTVASSASAVTVGTELADNSGQNGFNVQDQGSSNNDDSTLTALGAPDQSNSDSMPPVGTLVSFPDFGFESSTTPTTNNKGSSTPGLPPGVFEAVRYAGNSAPIASSTTDSGTQDNGGSAQYMLGSPNTAAPNGFGGAADFLNNQSGSQTGASPTSASWLTENAQNCSTLTNGAAQVPSTSGFSSNPVPIVTADNLQNLLHTGSTR